MHEISKYEAIDIDNKVDLLFLDNFIKHNKNKMKILNNKTLLITGGTGSFGSAAVEYLLKKSKLKKIIVFQEMKIKQYFVNLNKFKDNRLRFFLETLGMNLILMAFRNVDFVIHAAAQKHVSSAEYNPIECIKTNVYGAQAIISASIKSGVKKVINLSTDKSVIQLIFMVHQSFVQKNYLKMQTNFSGKSDTKFSIVRYGNVIASRGSVIPLF